MRPAFLTLALLAVAPTAVFTSTAEATSFRDISLEELTARSTIVVEAEVVHTKYRQQPGRLPVVTEGTLRVIRYLRGSGPAQIILWQPGGVIDGMRYQVVGSPEFRRGERVVLFLKPKPGYGADTFYLFGLELGAYQVARGADGVLWASRRSRAPQTSSQGATHGMVAQPSQVSPHSFTSQVLPQALPLWQLVARIKAVR